MGAQINLTDTIRFRPITRRDLTLVMAGLICLISLFAITWVVTQFISDWGMAFRPALWRWFRGDSPYTPERGIAPFANAPWILPILAPFALLTMRSGHAVVLFVNLACYVLLMRKLHATKLAAFAFLLSPPVITGLIGGQIDGMLSLGYILPPVFGSLVILAKPQIGIGLLVFWAFKAWKKDRVLGVMKIFLPSLILIAVSVWLFPEWIPAMTNLPDIWWNTSLWPQAIPLGVAMLYFAIKRNDSNLAVSSSVFFTPYLAWQGWFAGLIGLVEDGKLMLLVSLSMWVVFLFL